MVSFLEKRIGLRSSENGLLEVDNIILWETMKKCPKNLIKTALKPEKMTMLVRGVRLLRFFLNSISETYYGYFIEF